MKILIYIIFVFFSTISSSLYGFSPKNIREIDIDSHELYYNNFAFHLVYLNKKEKKAKTCSGFTVGEYSITNNHCMPKKEDCNFITAYFYNKIKSYPCEKFFYTSEKLDITIFRLKDQKELPFLDVNWDIEDNKDNYIIFSKWKIDRKEAFHFKKCQLADNFILKPYYTITMSDGENKKRVSRGKFFDKCETKTIKGNSGSPVLSFDKESGLYQIVGIVWGIGGKEGTYWSLLDDLPSKARVALKKSIKKRREEHFISSLSSP